MSPNAAASVLLDMARRGVGQTPASAPPPAQQGQAADPPLSPGTYGRTLALIQNNQPLNLAARAAADLLKAHPNMSDRELGLAMGAINPVLAKQADAVLRDARLSDTDFFKTVGLLLNLQRTQSQVDKNEAQAGEHAAKADYYSGGGGAGATGAAPQAADANSPNPNLSGMQQQVIQSWLGGGKLPVGGPQGVAARREEANLQQQLGLPPGAIPAIGQQAKSSQATVTQLQNRYAQFQTSAKTLEKQFDQVREIAKQLQLNGIATTNKGRLIIDRKLAPTGSAQGQLVAQYDALVNEMAREYGIVTGFGKMTGYAFKSAEKVFDPAQGVAIDGVADAVQFGTKQAENAYQDTLQYYQSLPQSKLIESAKNKPLAAQYVGFKLMDSKTFADYAKQHFNGDTDAAQRYLIAHRIYPE
jgi:prolyl-tRNA editing enzyme YbaK/EbsC (Cys-tRNA(Pro) deacylase)